MPAETLSVNGLSLDIEGAWRAMGYSALLSTAPVRGDDLPLWRVTGQRGQPRWIDKSLRTIGLHVFGIKDRTGTPHSDQRMGLVTNIEYLEANLGIGSTSGDGSVTCAWTRRDSSTRTFAAIVLPFVDVAKQTPTWAKTSIGLVVPAGRLS